MTNEFSKEEVLKNMSDMTPFLLNLLDRNKKDTFFEIKKRNTNVQFFQHKSNSDFTVGNCKQAISFFLLKYLQRSWHATRKTSVHHIHHRCCR
mgnify:CR=1 FL=1